MRWSRPDSPRLRSVEAFCAYWRDCCRLRRSSTREVCRNSSAVSRASSDWVPYPTQSVASIFMIVQAMLGFEVLGFERKLVIDSPAMPEWLEWLKIENLKIGDGAVSLLIRRSPEVPAIEILEKHGPITVEI